MRYSAGHLPGQKKPQRLLQALIRALALIHHDPKVKRRERERRDERLQLYHGEGFQRMPVNAQNDSELDQADRQDGARESVAQCHPDERQEQQIDMV